MNSKTMMLCSTLSYDNKPTFQLVPVDANCPYLECVFLPERNTLVIVGKYKRQSFHMLPKLDETGAPIPVGKAKPEFRQQRVSVESFYEYYIRSYEEIKGFVEMFAINADSYDFQSYLEMARQAEKNEAPEQMKPMMVKSEA